MEWCNHGAYKPPVKPIAFERGHNMSVNKSLAHVKYDEIHKLGAQD